MLHIQRSANNSNQHRKQAWLREARQLGAGSGLVTATSHPKAVPASSNPERLLSHGQVCFVFGA